MACAVSGQVLEAGQSNLEGMSDVALRQLLKKLEKDKTEMEWKLKEYGWRLDQASAVCLIILYSIIEVIILLWS